MTAFMTSVDWEGSYLQKEEAEGEGMGTDAEEATPTGQLYEQGSCKIPSSVKLLSDCSGYQEDLWILS